MSSILKALKKLENQAPQQKQGQSWPPTDTKGTIRSQAKRHRLFNRSVSVLIIAVIVAGGWFAFSQKPLRKFFPAGVAEKETDVRPAEKKIPGPDMSQKKAASLEDHKDAERTQKNAPAAVVTRKTKPEKPEDFSEKKIAAADLPHNKSVSPEDIKQKREKAPATVTKRKSEPEKSADLSKKKAEAPQKKEPVSLEKKEESGQTKKQAPLSAAKIKTGSEKKSSALPKDIASDLDMLQEHVGKMRDMVTKPEQSAKLDLLEKEVALWKEKHASGELKPDPRNTPSSGHSTTTKPKQKNNDKLKIQAIVWSSNPEDRMAVVNDKIVRAGGSVDGVVVTHIGEDYILVKEGKEEWEVKFQLKGGGQ